MSGKLFIQWRHTYCAITARKRYIDKEIARQAHKEIVNLFFPQEEQNDDSDESHNTDEKSDEKSGGGKLQFIYIYTHFKTTTTKTFTASNFYNKIM